MWSIPAAKAQTASRVLVELADGGPRLSAAVADAVERDIKVSWAFCEAARPAAKHVRVAVGTGLADAVVRLRQTGDEDGAGQVTRIVCSCDGPDGEIELAYAFRLGAPLEGVCMANWDWQAGRPEGLMWIKTDGGAGIAGRSVTAN